MKVGDWVMAIGNPFGLGGSVSVGIISAKQRDINTGPYDDFLQTDAAINRGNSGGPLFNMDGEVIGVNTAIISPSGGSIGIGFAVPSDSAVVVLDQLRQFGETRRGWLGVNVQSVTEDVAETYGIREGTGARVASVAPDGPAAKAGILQDDVIVRFDGKDVTSMRGLPRLVSQTQIGKEVEVEVSRKGQRRTFRVTIGRLVEEVEAGGQGRRQGAAQEPQQGQGQGRQGRRCSARCRLTPPRLSRMASLGASPHRPQCGRRVPAMAPCQSQPEKPLPEDTVSERHSLIDTITDGIVPVHSDGYKFLAIGAGVSLLLFWLWPPLAWLAVLVTA